ncbi:MAG: hypothetical protein HUN04_12920 [Desulfobacter sp.]|nr:MAG: hypothetical protein HUN04_12920 [Desulfobacter sp.]
MIKSKGKIRLPYFGIFALFFIVGIASAVFNNNLGVATILGMRLVFRFYVFFLALANAGLSYSQLKKVNTLIIVIFLIQIPASIVKLVIYGQGEQAVGTYAMNDGAAPVIITLVSIGFAMAFYFYYKPRWRYILAAFAFISLSLIGEKRAIIFFLPLLVMFTIFCGLMDAQTIKRTVPNFKFKLVLVSVLMVVLTTIGAARLMRTLNPESKVGGSIDFNHIIIYAKDYTTYRDPNSKRYTAGRFSSTKQVISVLYQKGPGRLVFGYGPGSYGKSRFADKRKRLNSPVFKDIFIKYGLTCFNFTLIEYGYAGGFIYFLFLIFINAHLYKNWRLSHEPYWKAVSFGTFLSGFVYASIWLIYSPTIYLGDYLPLLFFYLFGQSIIQRKILYPSS